MEEGVVVSEIINSEEYSKYEKSQVVEAVSQTIDSARKKGISPVILLHGGPGVGKSTSSYEALEYFENKGMEPVWIQPEELARESARVKIKNANPNTVIFIDSVDSAFSSDIDEQGLFQTVQAIKEVTAGGKGPVVVANIHDPWLIRNGEMEQYLPKRELLLGKSGLFSDKGQYIKVEDECRDDKSVRVVVDNGIDDAKVDKSWSQFLYGEVKSRGIKTHSMISHLLSSSVFYHFKEQLPEVLKQPFNETSGTTVKTWLDGWVEKIKQQNEKFTRVYYNPGNEEDAYKGLVRQDLIPIPKVEEKMEEPTPQPSQEIIPTVNQATQPQKAGIFSRFLRKK